MMPVHEELLREIQDFALTASTAMSLMERIAQCLHEKMMRNNWVGFYLVDPTDPGVLLVGPFVGSFTPNARIPLSKGLCGAAASSGQVVVVHDVAKDPRYLSGSPMVKCDIESYFAGTFTKAEQDFVQACAAGVAKFLREHSG